MTKPIVFFDLETTGPDAVQDRAVQFAAIKELPDGTTTAPRNTLIKPGIPILPAATEVHGITEEMVKDKPSFCEMADDLFAYLEGCDYAGYNIIQFDVPMLSEEFGRCGFVWPAPDAKFLDAFHVFREKEKRDLTAAVKFYVGGLHETAHDALGDVLATRSVLKAQMDRYEEVGDIDKFAAFCANPNALDLAGKIVLNEHGEGVYSFGKDKGKSVKKFPGFGQWMLNQSFPTNTKNIVRSLIQTQQA